MAEVWYEALCLIADYGPMVYWRMSNGAEFWWMPKRSQLGSKQFAEEPFGYDEIVSVTVFDAVWLGTDVVACDWPALRGQLLGVRGLRAEELRDVRCPLASPPNKALRMTLAATQVSGSS